MASPKLDVFETAIFQLLSEGYSYEDISEYIRRQAGQSQGFSSRSIRRYIANQDVRVRCGIDQVCLDAIVHSSVMRVGHSYGRRTMQGLLRLEGVWVSQ